MRSTLHNPRCERSKGARCVCTCGGSLHGIAHQTGEAGTFADEQAPGMLKPEQQQPIFPPDLADRLGWKWVR